MAGLIILTIMAAVLVVLDIAALRWGVDSRPLVIDGRKRAAPGIR
jgi:hypothetical protein